MLLARGNGRLVLRNKLSVSRTLGSQPCGPRPTVANPMSVVEFRRAAWRVVLFGNPMGFGETLALVTNLAAASTSTMNPPDETEL